MSRLSEEQAQAFFARLQALADEFGAADVDAPEGDDAQAYALSIAFYPSFSYPEQSDTSDERADS